MERMTIIVDDGEVIIVGMIAIMIIVIVIVVRGQRGQRGYISQAH
jgi:hypothetical protein